MRLRGNGLVLAVALALAAALLLVGCAAIRTTAARSTGRLLTEAGFQAEPAEPLASLPAVEPLKLVARSRDGDVIYVYADPYDCRCLYVGGPAERSAYESLVAQRRRARDERDPAADWEGWSPWWWHEDRRR